MNNSVIRRPVVILSTLIAITSFGVLSFPERFDIILSTILILAIGLFSLYYLRKNKLLAFIFPFILIFCALFCRVCYVCTELASKNLISSLDGDTHTFCARVEKCTVNGNLSNFMLKITSVDDIELDVPQKASAFCFSGDYADTGDTLEFEATAQDLSEMSADTFSSFLYLKARKTFIYLPNISIKSSHAENNPSFLDLIRKNIREIIYKYIPQNYSYTSASIANALVLGDTSLIPKDLKNSFIISGLTHILSVSGMHVSIITGFLCVLLSVLPINKKHVFITACVFCVFYVALTGFLTSAIRAGIMSVLMCFSVIFLKRSDSFDSLFTAITLIFLFNPYSVFDISLYLSFFATLGIIVSLGYSSSYSKKNVSCTKRVFQCILKSINVNLFAVAFTMPISVLAFGGVSVVGIFSTLCISFICSVVMVLLLVLVVCGLVPFLNFVCVPTGLLVDSLINFIKDISLLFSSLEYAYIPVSNSFSIMLIFACLIAILFFALYRLNSFGLIFAKRGVIFLCISITVFSLYNHFSQSGTYKISYFRKNVFDRQLSIKTGQNGYLLINADSTLCFDSEKLPFDNYSGKNSLLIIDDKSIDKDILYQNIVLFDSRFGLQEVFIPKDSSLQDLMLRLSHNGIECHQFPDIFTKSNTVITLKRTDYDWLLTVFDGRTSCKIVFSENYNKDMFAGFADICAYFTRDNDGQFSIANDTKPDCIVFYTRLNKGLSANGIINTYGKESFYIKE